MIASVVLFVITLAAVDGATTVTMPPTTTTEMPTTTTAMQATVLYDFNHVMIAGANGRYDYYMHKAMIVREDGCYEYHMNHQDVIDAQNSASRPTLEARMRLELSMSTNIHETGHNHINHMTSEIRNACASLPVYSFEIPQNVLF